MNSRLAPLFRLAAITLMVCIGQDLAADVGCDPFISAPAKQAMANDSRSTEDCRGVCVPDCFCCSVLVADDLTAQIEAIGPVTTEQHRPYERNLDGVSALVFHPPLHRA